MAKRFTDSELWNRDWFLNLEGKHQLFALYLRDQCDHAGVWNPSFKRFEQSTGFRIKAEEYISACNIDGVVRILILNNGKWWLTGFIEDQYKTKEINTGYNPHKGIENSLRFNQVPYNSYSYNLRVGDTSPSLKDKDKDKDKDVEEVKKLRSKEEKKEGVEIPEHLKEIWPSFLEMRKEKKAVNSDRAIKMLLNELNKLSTNSDTQIKIVEQSIRSSWKDVYQLKDQQGFGKTTQNSSLEEKYPLFNGVV